MLGGSNQFAWAWGPGDTQLGSFHSWVDISLNGRGEYFFWQSGVNISINGQGWIFHPTVNVEYQQPGWIFPSSEIGVSLWVLCKTWAHQDTSIRVSLELILVSASGPNLSEWQVCLISLEWPKVVFTMTSFCLKTWTGKKKIFRARFK